MQRDVLAVFERAARLGDLVRIPLPHRTGYLVNHPDGVRRVLVENHRNYGKRTRGYQVLEIVLGQGLVTSQGATWKHRRRIAQPAFHHRKIKVFLSTMDDAIASMLARWRTRYPEGAVVPVDEEMNRLTLEVVSRCLLGTDPAQDSDVFGDALTVVLHETVRRMTEAVAMPLWVPTSRNRRLGRALRQMDDEVGRVIARRRSEGGQEDLLSMLVAARDEETGTGLTDAELRDEVLTMILAGHETTANALAWTFCLLGDAPESRLRLEEEAEAALPREAVDYEDVAALRYTGAVFHEALRLYPPLWIIGRSVEGPDVILGHAIPSDSIVFLVPYLMHRDPRFWDNPKSFDPERFLDEGASKSSKYAYFPFAAGPRSCIGQSFATLESKLVLGRLAQSLRLDPVSEAPVVPEATVTLRPKGGLPMRIHWRN